MKDGKSLIKIVVMDVDGTLTDGIVYIGNDGELCKGFYVRDGIGILNLMKAGMIPVVFTSRESGIVVQRCRELGIDHIYQGVQKKEEKFREIMKEMGVKPEETAYIADDINDYEAMKLAGIRGCPADAVTQIKEICDFISSYDGGKGAVRDFIGYLLKAGGYSKSELY